MAGWLKIVLGVVVVAVLVGAWSLLEDDGAGSDAGPGRLGDAREPAGEGPDMELRAAGQGRSAEVRPLVAETSSTEPPTEVAAAVGEPAVEPEGPRVTLVGRLVDPVGRPVPEARVLAHVQAAAEVRLRGGPRSAGEPPERPETLSGRDGSFRLEFPLPEDDADEDGPGAALLVSMFGGGARLAAVHEAFAVFVEKDIALREGEVDLGTLTLQPGASVLGRVVDERGSPVAGATVVGRAASQRTSGPGAMLAMLAGGVSETYTRATTGSDGRFRVGGLAAGSVGITAEADGKQLGHVDDVELLPGDALDLGDVVLADGGSIAGWVVGPDDEPVAGASVRVSSMSRIVLTSLTDLPRRDLGREMRLRAETDADGWFELDGLGSGQYSVHVEADGFARSSKDNVATGTRDLRVRLGLLGSLVVTVRSARTGELVTDAEVSARRTERFGPGEPLEVREGEQPGRWVVEGANDAGTEVSILADGFASLVHEGPAVEPGGRRELELELLTESVLAGRVLDVDGRGVAGARVSVRAWVEPADPFASDGMRIERRVGRGMGFDGAADWQRARTDDEGRFLLRSVPGGEWELLAAADGYVRSDPLHVSLDVGGEQRDLSLVLARAGVLTGLVLDEQGQAVEGASVRVTPQAAEPDEDDPLAALGLGNLFGGDDGDPSAPRTTTTDDEGGFRLEDLPAGPVLAELTKGGAGLGFGGAMVFIAGSGGGGDAIDHPDARAEATIVPGEESFVRLLRPAMSSLEGRVLADGLGVPDVTVSLREAGSFLPFGGLSATTDRLGGFVFEDVQPGEYTLAGQIASAGLEQTVEVELSAGRRERADLVFTGQSLRGRVVDVDSGLGVAGVSVQVEAQVEQQAGPQTAVSFAFRTTTVGGGGSGMTIDMGGGGSRIQTDADGGFEARWLPPGDYVVKVSGGGLMDAESDVIELEEGSDRDGLVIEAARGAVIHGVLTDRATGQVLEGVPVSLTESSGGQREMQVTAADGAYRFEGLAPGAYAVSVMGSGFGAAPSAESDVELESGEVRALDLQTGE